MEKVATFQSPPVPVATPMVSPLFEAGQAIGSLPTVTAELFVASSPSGTGSSQLPCVVASLAEQQQELAPRLKLMEERLRSTAHKLEAQKLCAHTADRECARLKVENSRLESELLAATQQATEAETRASEDAGAQAERRTAAAEAEQKVEEAEQRAADAVREAVAKAAEAEQQTAVAKALEVRLCSVEKERDRLTKKVESQKVTISVGPEPPALPDATCL